MIIIMFIFIIISIIIKGIFNLRTIIIIIKYNHFFLMEIIIIIINSIMIIVKMIDFEFIILKNMIIL
jgi:hypothetical protein